MSLRKGIGVAELVTGIVGFGLGLFFGWMLHRERVGGADSRSGITSDRATSALAGASARLEEADQDVVELRTQLTDAQHLLDESAAAIAELEYELAECRGEEVDETLAITSEERLDDASVDVAADDATTPAIADADIDDVDVTEEVVVAEAGDEEIPEADRTQQDLSPLHDETEAIPVRDDAGSGPGIDDTQTLAIDETEVIELPGEETEVVERPSVAAPPTGTTGAEEITEPVVEEPVAQEPVVEEPAVEEPVAEPEPEPDAAPTEEVVTRPAGPPAGDAGAAFVAPPDAEPDDLQRIRGVGPAMVRLLNEQGIMTFRQLAVLDDAGIDELQSRLPGFSGRIRRDRWIEQARELHVETHGDQP
jgi:predicted flap endonuclease-1-like 5' DNA nuclease